MPKRFLAFSILVLFSLSVIAPYLHRAGLYSSAKSVEVQKRYPVLAISGSEGLNVAYVKDAVVRTRTHSYKILFDVGHAQYYDESKMESMLDMLRILADVEINEDSITEDDLVDVDLLIITKPDAAEANFTEDEIAVIQDYLENKGGALFLLGEWYRYFDPGNFNNITRKYGIIWYDADVFNDVLNDGKNYHPYIYQWPNNYITSNMSIIGQVTRVVFSGTALGIIEPEDPALIMHGPYPIGVGDDDTYIVFENGTTVMSGNDTIVFAAVELASGGKIFASGSSWMFAYDNIYKEDNLAFLLLVVGWLIGIPPDVVLIPIIRDFDISEKSYVPQETGELTAVVTNLANIEKHNVSLRIDIPYFLEVVDGKATITRGEKTFEVPYIPGEPFYFGDLGPKETITITMTLRCVVGIRESGMAKAALYVAGTQVFESSISLEAFPAFYAEVGFKDFPLNVSRTNSTVMSITIHHNATYPLWNITILISSVSEGVTFNVTRISGIILGVGGTVTKHVEVTVSGTGVYSIIVRIIEDVGGETVLRPTLVATEKPIILFDEAHNQYWAFTSAGMSDFIELLSQFAPVVILRGEVTADILTPQVTGLYVIPNPQPSTGSPSDTTTAIFSDSEVEIIQQYVESGGSLLMMGNWYRYFWPDNPNGFNDITEKYGIIWVDGDVYDDVNNFGQNWHIKAMVFADNSLAQVMSTGVDYVEYSGTGLLITDPAEDITAELYPILIGNNSTYLTEGEATATKVANGTDVIMILAAIINENGKILASGSSYMFSSNYYYQTNEGFIRNMLAWLLGVKTLNVEIYNAPYQVEIGHEFTIIVRVSNGGYEALTDVQVEVAYSAGLSLLNETTTYDIGTLNPGQIVEFSLTFKSDQEGTYTVTIKVSATNYDKIVTKSFVVNYYKPEFAIPLEYILAFIIVPIILLPLIYVYIRAKKAQTG